MLSDVMLKYSVKEHEYIVPDNKNTSDNEGGGERYSRYMGYWYYSK